MDQFEIEIRSVRQRGAEGIEGSRLGFRALDDGRDQARLELRFREDAQRALLDHFLADMGDPLGAGAELRADRQRGSGMNVEAILEILIAVMEDDEGLAPHGRKGRFGVGGQLVEARIELFGIRLVGFGIVRIGLGKRRLDDD